MPSLSGKGSRQLYTNVLHDMNAHGAAEVYLEG